MGDLKCSRPVTREIMCWSFVQMLEETVFFIDEMTKRQVPFDIIGLSYYPKCHGTSDDLRDNMLDLINRYNTDIVVVAYSAKKQLVNKIAFDLPGDKGKGTFIYGNHLVPGTGYLTAMEKPMKNS